MELIAVFLLLTMAYVPASAERTLVTKPEITATMNHQPTMTCTYDFRGMKNDWLLIRWSMYVSENEKIRLAVLQKGMLAVPEWSDSAPENFRDHVELVDNVGSTSVSFDMRIDGFKCSDVGKYICEVITLNDDHEATTVMYITVKPEMPLIREDLIQVKENDTFKIRCHGNVGLPSTTLRWSYMMQGRDIYQLVETGVSQEDSEARDCMIKGTSSLEMTMTPEFDGAAFICYTGVDLVGDSENRKYSQVILELAGKPTVAPPTSTAAPCVGENCDRAYAAIGDNGATSCVHCAAATLLASLVISLLLVRTS